MGNVKARGNAFILILSEINKQESINDKFKIVGKNAKGANLPIEFNIAPKSETTEIIGKNKIVNLDRVTI